VQEFTVGVKVVPREVSAPVHIRGAVAFDPAVFLVVAGHVGLEIECEIFDAGARECMRHILFPCAFGVPETFGALAEILFINALGKFTGPVAVLFGDVGHNRVGVGCAHEFALSAVNCGFEFFENVRRHFGHLFDGVARGFKNKFGFRIFGKAIDDHFVGSADDAFVAFRDQVGVVEVGVKQGHILHVGSPCDGFKNEGRIGAFYDHEINPYIPFFQPLEKMLPTLGKTTAPAVSNFPNLGKNESCFSKGWKHEPDGFWRNFTNGEIWLQ